MSNYPEQTTLSEPATVAGVKVAGAEVAEDAAGLNGAAPTEPTLNGTTTAEPALNGTTTTEPTLNGAPTTEQALSGNAPAAPTQALSPKQICALAETIAEWQLPSGMIPWFPDGHADPWNHVEAAMALTVGGFFKQAQKAYQWLLTEQLPNGAWHQYYLRDGIEDDKLDTNCVAYIATGVWHYFLSTGDRDFLEKMWPATDQAINFVCDAQTQRGEVLWARRANGIAWDFALLTGSSSIYHSLLCAEKIARSVGVRRPRWSNGRKRLGRTIVNVPEAFAPKQKWAMDWYYPVLSGALQGAAAKQRLSRGWNQFVLDGLGVRCVADKDWITAAETAECAMAHYVAGEHALAQQLFEWLQMLRDRDNRYWTGRVFPQQVHFPADEKTTYSSAAVILAAAMLGVVPSEATRQTFASA